MLGGYLLRTGGEVPDYLYLNLLQYFNIIQRNRLVFITSRHQRSENSPVTTQNSPAMKFRLFLERALLFHNNSRVTLQYTPATTVCNENPDYIVHMHVTDYCMFRTSFLYYVAGEASVRMHV